MTIITDMIKMSLVLMPSEKKLKILDTSLTKKIDPTTNTKPKSDLLETKLAEESKNALHFKER